MTCYILYYALYFKYINKNIYQNRNIDSKKLYIKEPFKNYLVIN